MNHRTINMGLIPFILFSCSAPEVSAPGPSPSPRELAAENKTDSSKPKMRILRVPRSNPSPAQNLAPPQQASESGSLPPYTSWTLIENVHILGPNGGRILTLDRIGVRLEIKEFSGQYSHVICSGCAAPRKNQAGWVKTEHLASAWDLPEGSPIHAAIELRRNWSKGKDLPENIEHKLDLCMIVDHGYKIDGDTAAWNIQGAEMILQKKDNNWKLSSIRPPSTSASSKWRCDVNYPKQDG